MRRVSPGLPADYGYPQPGSKKNNHASVRTHLGARRIAACHDLLYLHTFKPPWLHCNPNPNRRKEFRARK